MAEDGKKSGMIAQIAIAVVVALCVGGTSPWWFKEMFSGKESPSVNASVQSEPQKPRNQDELASLDRSQLEDRQRKLEQELAELKRDQQVGPQARPVQGQANIGGTWQGSGGGCLGSTYNFSQTGSNVTMEETSPSYGRTAIGEGLLNQNSLEITVFTALLTQGTLKLALSGDGRQMTGTYTDNSLGRQVPCTITK